MKIEPNDVVVSSICLKSATYFMSKKALKLKKPFSEG